MNKIIIPLSPTHPKKGKNYLHVILRVFIEKTNWKKEQTMRPECLFWGKKRRGKNSLPTSNSISYEYKSIYVVKKKKKKKEKFP